MDTEKLQLVPGAEKIVDWFGFWPTFHDSEVVSVELNREAVSHLRVHAFRTTATVSAKGHYVTDQHAIVHFHVAEIVSVTLSDFNHQNVLSGLDIRDREGSYVVELSPCYGLSGEIVAKSLTLDFDPGIPEGSIYRESSQA